MPYPHAVAYPVPDVASFPPKDNRNPNDPNDKRVCLSELMSWLAANGFTQNRVGSGGKEYYTSTQYPDWQVRISRTPASGPSAGPESRYPRVQIYDGRRGPATKGGEGGFYNPFDGRYYPERSGPAHIRLDLSC